MLEILLQSDEKLFLFLNNLGSIRWDGFWLFITHKWSALPLYLFILIVLYKNTSRKQFALTLIVIALLITCTDQTANLFKNHFERLRPCNFPFEDRSIANCGRYGFFSAHAASAMAFAAFIGSVLKPHFKFLRIFLIFWALLVGYSRIYVGVHYPGDVLVGFLFGGCFGMIFYYLLKFFDGNILFKKTPKTQLF